MTENVIWVPVKGYENQYLISTTGVVKSISRTMLTEGKRRTVAETIISQRVDRSGYQSVCLKRRGRSATKCLHRLLAENFLLNPYGKCCVNHIDGNKLNNGLLNLEWCTHKENMKHAYRTGLSKVPQPKRKRVIDACTGIEYESIQEAATALHINAKTCNHYLHGRLKNPTCLKFAA